MLLVEKATELSHSGAKEINQIRKGMLPEEEAFGLDLEGWMGLRHELYLKYLW